MQPTSKQRTNAPQPPTHQHANARIATQLTQLRLQPSDGALQRLRLLLQRRDGPIPLRNGGLQACPLFLQAANLLLQGCHRLGVPGLQGATGRGEL